MSLSLGEKLRQAREARGISISEVAEQTRISSLYLESIENDNYKPLPGGIFNKGFVKSYAKFIGVDEQEALSDYARLASENEIATEHDLKVYRPEVLTDDNSSRSMLPTIVFAGIILALMTGGILFVLNYLQNPENSQTNSGNTVANSNTSNASVANSSSANQPANSDAPTMSAVKIEFRAAADPVALTSVTDGKRASATVATGTAVTFEPKESLKLSYSKSLASSAQLSINGKPIALPAAPENPRRNAIEFEINESNLAKIWEEGRISYEQELPADAGTNVNASNVTAVPTPAATRPPSTPPPTPKPTVSIAKTPPPTSNSGTSSNAAPKPSPN